MVVPVERTSARREQIVAAAFRRVATGGLARLRMREVADEAGVNIATVHYHLTSKAELVRAVVEHVHDRFAAHAVSPPGIAEPAQRLRVHLDDVFGLLERDPDLARVLAEVALESAHDPVVAEVVASAETRWRRAVQAFLRPLPVRRSRPVAALVVLAVKGACLPPADPATVRAARRALEEGVVAAIAAPG